MTEVLIIAFSVLFIYGVFQEGMILSSLGDWLEIHLPIWLYLPLIGCPACMTVWWGIPLWFIFGFNGDIIATLMAAGGLNLIISSVYEYITDIIEDDTDGDRNNY